MNQHAPHTADSSECPCFSEFRKSHYSSAGTNTSTTQISGNNSAPHYSSAPINPAPTGYIPPFYYHGNVPPSQLSAPSAQFQQSSYAQLQQGQVIQQGNVQQQQYIPDNRVTAASLNHLNQTAGHM